ncbi:sideroflexin-1-like [Dendronephthya gigantea]|uniref:sideroflexin-1-like n=1 Tax=Dendronephthya gigantea TaxID=151771 RepID=UPI00106B740A|nr:sideroflexin-1-like [Dendronephthya gigantea]
MAEAPRLPDGRIDLDHPRYDQTTFWGRAKHFFTVTDPRNLLHSEAELDRCKNLLQKYRVKLEPPGTTDEDIWYAKKIYESAFHPETGEKMFIVGRMSAQVPCNMTIVGCMMTFYKTTPQVLFWQWINQSFNAIVNYTNRSGDSHITNQQLTQAYVVATTSAVAVAVGLNSLVKKAPPLVGRFVPFVAVASANCVNIPLMRQRELKNGIPVYDKEGNKLGISKYAAKIAVPSVVLSRVIMTTPGMVIPPFIMNRLDATQFMKRLPWTASPIQVFLVGCCLVFATPMCCAIFPQRFSLAFNHLEPELQEELKRKDQVYDYVYFNKGL